MAFIAYGFIICSLFVYGDSSDNIYNRKNSTKIENPANIYVGTKYIQKIKNS